MRQFLLRHASCVLLGVVLYAPSAAASTDLRFATARDVSRPATSVDIFGAVTDSITSTPISSAQVTIQDGERIVVNVLTDAFGRYRAHHIPSGRYTVRVRFLGFRPFERTVTIADADTRSEVRVDARLVAAAAELSTVSVTAGAPVAVDTRTGDQSYDQNRSHASPTTTASQLIQQSVAGSARAPTGEVHIRGQHAEYTYFVDGVPVPSGVSGSLNELFDPAVVNSINFKTGGWDAEFGNKNAAVIDVTTRIPSGGFHLNAAGYGGAFSTNGQSMNASTNHGKFGFFGALSRQETAMRREPVLFDTITFNPYNFHNHGDDVFGFGKLQYTPTSSDVINLEGNWTRTTRIKPVSNLGWRRCDSWTN